MIVYMITNKINGKKYIGQTTSTIARRWSEHNAPSSNYCRVLKRALVKYGSILMLGYLEEKRRKALDSKPVFK